MPSAGERPTVPRNTSAYRPGHVGCLLIDANLSGMSGLDLLQNLLGGGDQPPAVVITGNVSEDVV